MNINVSQYFLVNLFIHYKKGKICQEKSAFRKASNTVHNTSQYNGAGFLETSYYNWFLSFPNFF